MSKQFYFKQFSFANVRNLNVKTFRFQAIHFSISAQFTSIWPIDKTLSGATTPRQSGPGSNDNKVVLRIHQSSSIIEASPSDCFVSYPRNSLEVSYPSEEKRSVYSTAPADWATRWGNLTPLQRCSRCILQAKPTEPLIGGIIYIFKPQWLLQWCRS